MTEEITPRTKLHGLYRVARFRPLLTAGVIGLSLFAAVLEGVGLSFILPIIETARASGQPGSDGVIGQITFKLV